MLFTMRSHHLVIDFVFKKRRECSHGMASDESRRQRLHIIDMFQWLISSAYHICIIDLYNRLERSIWCGTRTRSGVTWLRSVMPSSRIVISTSSANTASCQLIQLAVGGRELTVDDLENTLSPIRSSGVHERSPNCYRCRAQA